MLRGVLLSDIFVNHSVYRSHFAPATEAVPWIHRHGVSLSKFNSTKIAQGKIKAFYPYCGQLDPITLYDC